MRSTRQFLIISAIFLFVIVFISAGLFFYNGTNFRIHPSSYLQVQTPSYAHPTDSNIIAAASITDFYEGGYTTGFYISTNNGLNWTGTDAIKNSAGTPIITLGDEFLVINNNGNYIMTYTAPSLTLGSDAKVGVSYSTNKGDTWSSTYFIPGTDTVDKPITETDNIPSSPFLGRTYLAYDELKNLGEEIKGIFFSYSTDGGVAWDSSRRLTDINPLYDSRLICDIAIGNAGEVFVMWYTNINYLGLAKSTNGGVSWISKNETAINTDSTTIIYHYGDVNLNSVPTLKIDHSGGPRNGWMYAVAQESNQDNLDIVLHRSTNNGVNWNYTKRVNTDLTGTPKIQNTPALNVDKYGGINVLYYDCRNSNSNDSSEVFLSRSTDGGSTFQDTKISDHKFKYTRPAVPLFGYPGYIGSYIGLTSGNDKLTPVWYDNSSGIYKAYSSSIELLPDFEVKAFPQGFLNTANLALRMVDTLRVYLRNSFSPYAIVDSSKSIIDSLTLNASLKFHSILPSGNYYLDVRHRNSIQTWSAFPVNYSFGSKVNYDFTLSAVSAFASNEVSVGGKFGIYSGDANQDGSVDLIDVLNIYNGSIAFLSGYVVQDCNGDSVVDLTDILIAYNNSILFVQKIIP